MTATTPPHPASTPKALSPWTLRLALAALTLLTLLLHGWHPFSEDGGVYAAGIRLSLDPALYPHDRAFVTAHLHFSLFAPAVAALVRLTHLPLEYLLLALDLLSIRLTLGAALRLTRHLTAHLAAQLAGITLLAVWWTLPIAGTSLVLMDPCLTARSFSTPLGLYALAFTLDLLQLRASKRTPFSPSILSATRKGALAPEGPAASSLTTFSKGHRLTLCLVTSFLLHPLMTAYTLSLLLAIALMSLHSPRRAAILTLAAALTLAAILHSLAPHASAAVTAASLSRTYWFLSRWQWYELCGLLGPLLIFALLPQWRAARLTPAARILCRAALLLTGTATLITLLFAHTGGPTYLVARLQPLRALLLLYALMALLLGTTLTQLLLPPPTQNPKPQTVTRTPWSRRLRLVLPAVTLIALAAAMFFAQRSLYPADAPLELPWLAPRNPWQQAFLYARDHTPANALFALDAHYITTPGEDAQLFRAIALRSQLPDFSKDGGIASITPLLAARWANGVAAQTRLSHLDDPARDARLQPLGVTWLLLHSSARTAHPCPYDNGTVKLCALQP
jgi:hypothetical protein